MAELSALNTLVMARIACQRKPTIPPEETTSTTTKPLFHPSNFMGRHCVLNKEWFQNCMKTSVEDFWMTIGGYQ